MGNDFAPDAGEGGDGSNKLRYVNPKEWEDATKDGQKAKVFRARIISRKSQGFEVWSTDDRPHRGKTKAALASFPLRDDKFNPGKKEPVREVVAFLVLDIADDTEKIFPIHQWGIKKGLISEMAEWGVPASGDIFEYDFLFIQTKTNGKTEYLVKVADASKGTAKYPLKPEQLERIGALKANGFDLEKYWTGEDPFPAASGDAGVGEAADAYIDEIPF